MAKIVRYNGNLVPFASASLGTERTIFGDVTQADDITSQYTVEFLRGWGIVGPSDQPTLQDFNAVSYTHGQILSYLHQMGIPEYNATQEYHIGSLCNVAGVVYSSLIDTNIGNTPASSPAQWLELYAQATTTLRGTAELATDAEMATGTSTTLVPPVSAVMSLFSKRVFATKDFIRIPDVPGGLIIQWGPISNAAGAAKAETLAIPFPTAHLAVVATGLQASGATQAYAVLNSKTLSTFTWTGFAAASGSAPVVGVSVGQIQGFFIAIGY